MLDYLESAFAVMKRRMPQKVGKPNVRLAACMCIHWAATGQVAALADWLAIRNPDAAVQPPGWPEPGTSRYPMGKMIDGGI